MKGSGATSLQLESNDTLHLSDVLYVLGMKINLVSISALEGKGYKVAFLDGKVLCLAEELKHGYNQGNWCCCRLSHTWGGTWQKSSSHSVRPWGQVSNQGCHLVLDSSV